MKAKEMLTSQNLSVGKVANDVGYESLSQFNREFKRLFGSTPGALRKFTASQS